MQTVVKIDSALFAEGYAINYTGDYEALVAALENEFKVYDAVAILIGLNCHRHFEEFGDSQFVAFQGEGHVAIYKLMYSNAW